MANYEIMGTESDVKNHGANSIIDFRSDTVTRPGTEMRAVMAAAEVGDDVYGDDTSVNALEAKMADLLGKEAALYVSSGSMSNLIALLTHCGRGEEYIGGDIYHISHYEAGGAAVLGGISPRHLQTSSSGGITVDQVKSAINPDDFHFAKSKLVCLENTVNGMVQDQAKIEKIAKLAHDNGLSVHLDGARLMNAVVASGKSAKELANPADTVSICLSKGLGAPVGSVLCGPVDFINRARYNRKLLGGGMRQTGIIASGGDYAISNNVDRLADDHMRARMLANGLNNIDGVSVDMKTVQTNMVFASVAPENQQPLAKHFVENGILADGGDPAFRFVTHLDVDDEAIERLIECVEGYFSSK